MKRLIGCVTRIGDRRCGYSCPGRRQGQSHRHLEMDGEVRGTIPRNDAETEAGGRQAHRSHARTQWPRRIPIQDTKYKDGDLSFKVVRERQGRKMTSTYTGKVKGDTITGKVQFGENQSRDWEAKRAKD